MHFDTRLFCCAVFLLTGAILKAADTNQIQEAAFLSHVRQLTYEGRRSGEGYFSPDGKALIFQSEREPGNPFYQIYVLDLESGDSHRVSPGIGKTTCGFFRPGSDEVLFASTHLDPEAANKQKAELDFRASGKQRRYSWDYDETFDIFSAHRDGSGLKRLTQAPGYDAEASYSPDGKRIVFCSIRDAYPAEKLSAEDKKRLEADPSYFGEIYIMDADGTRQTRLTTTPGYDGGPFFSPDGKRLVWRRFDQSGTVADIYTMNTDGSAVRQLTSFGAMSWAPYHHPSGEYLIFASNKLGFTNFELYLVDTAGEHEPVRVTFTDGFDGLPVFDPSGKCLCWTANRTSDGKSQLFMADWDHAAALARLGAAPSRSNPTAESHGSASSSGGIQQPPSPDSSSARSAALAMPAQLTPAIAESDLRAEVGYLASDALEGRLTGAAGARLASEFIAAEFQKAGLRPMGDGDTYFQNFEFNAGVKVVTNRNTFAIDSTNHALPIPELILDRDFRPLSFTAEGDVEGNVVFAGYGLSVPGKEGERYDSYAGLDVTNKIVLVLRYVPESVDAKRRQELLRYAGLRYKAMLAREHGAKAILVVTGPNSPNAGELAPLSFDTSLSGSGILAATVSGKLADVLFAAAGKDLKAIQSALDTENPHAESSFAIPRLRLKLGAAVEFIKKRDRNVIGAIPPSSSAPQEYCLVGAHYDHLGFGESGAMLRAGEEGQIHNGADDNASGVAAVLELAAYLARQRQEHPETSQRGVLFALWSGEELGLVGSSKFAEHPVVELSNVVAYVNFDMVGRLRENKLTLQGVGSSTLWRRLIEKRNVAAGFNLVLQDDPYLPTDVTALYPKHVPVLNFFTGSHEDYHRPTDDPDTLNYEGLERISRFALGVISDLLKDSIRPEYVKVEQTSSGGSRDNLRVYLGTIPDYTTEVAGVKLSGVRGGSPAEKGGLQAGDVIVEFAHQKVANIYDYTYALDAAKVGQPVEIVVQRNGVRIPVTVVPETRK